MNSLLSFCFKCYNKYKTMSIPENITRLIKKLDYFYSYSEILRSHNCKIYFCLNIFASSRCDSFHSWNDICVSGLRQIGETNTLLTWNGVCRENKDRFIIPVVCMSMYVGVSVITVGRSHTFIRPSDSTNALRTGDDIPIPTAVSGSQLSPLLVT